MQRVKNPHAVLGVEPGASPDELRSAFRRLVHQTHPDKNPQDPRAAKRLARVVNAYRQLTFEANLEKEAAQDDDGLDLEQVERLIQLGAKILSHGSVQTVLLDIAARGVREPVGEVLEFVRRVLNTAQEFEREP